ncbi:S8 family serine peptidase [Flavisolibacter nicotianae]|uniref:S8 family serine peptidase n=1 Tax=Flavisolibacter nicotianae TaxID=2364882 RepID=UPI000EAE7935|nr:S8 family serine peptidase [Flavisolibacter nicotianae]
MAKARRKQPAAPVKKRASASQKVAVPDDNILPPEVFAHASVRSVGGVSLFESSRQITKETVFDFYSPESLVVRAVEKLKAAGFRIMGVNGITVSIAAPAATYEAAFQTKLGIKNKYTIKEMGKRELAQFILPEDGNVPGTIDVRKTSFRDVLEGVSINEPVYFMGSAFPPAVDYWHLAVPGDVSAGLNADWCHRNGISGRNVRVCMVDSGWYRHPYFTRRGYRSRPVVLGPATANPLADESGHGTGESANLFAVAPDVDFTMVKMHFADASGAFNTAAALRPGVISCSWGKDKPQGPLSGDDLVLSAAIANAVVNGTTVVFSAGNGGWGFPGQHPDVISAGGVYMDENFSLQASDYASGFASNIYNGRNVPDVCGLVGLQPTAAYIMLPVQPGDEIDQRRGGGSFPNNDETQQNDGWAVFSGTSAAAPQIAGVCAILKQVRPSLTPVQVKDLLKATAIDITKGASHTNTGGHPAKAGPDLATGNGLVDAWRAANAALRLVSPPVQTFWY